MNTFYVGSKIRDLNQNIYLILKTKYTNSHSQYPSEYLCFCIDGPNRLKERWITRKALLETDVEILDITSDLADWWNSFSEKEQKEFLNIFKENNIIDWKKYEQIA